MAETDVLNPSTGYSEDLGFNPNWSYGTPQPIGDNMTYTRVRRGPAIARETGCAGYSFDMVFVDCTWEKVQRIERFYKQFKRGYFTIIDHDGGGRHYVGRFVKPPTPVHTGNLKYTIQGLTFEEVQGARMQQYPDDWDRASYFIYALSDDLTPNVNTVLLRDGVTSLGPLIEYVSTSLFTPQQTPEAVIAGASLKDPSSYEMYNDDGNPATFAQIEYVGWGFRMNFRLSDDLGIIDIYLDGVKLIALLDLYTGVAASAGPAVLPGNPDVAFTLTGGGGGGNVLITVQNVPLDAHRVKVVPTRTKNAFSAGYAAIYPPLQVMY